MESKNRPWKDKISLVFAALFIVVWLLLCMSLQTFSWMYRNGSDEKTITHTEPIVSHGNVVYITKEEKDLLDISKPITCAAIGVVIIGLVLNFVGIPALRIGEDKDSDDY